MHFIAQIIEKRTDCGQFSRSGRRGETCVRIFTMLVDQAITAQIGHITVNIRQRDSANEGNIDIHNADLIERNIAQRRIAGLFQISEKIPQIKEIFINGF